MKSQKLTLSILPENLSIFHLDKNSPLPNWVKDRSFFVIARTRDELSIVCSQNKIPGGILAEKDWRAFKV